MDQTWSDRESHRTAGHPDSDGPPSDGAGRGRARGRRAATAVLALGGFAFGGWISQEAAMSHGRLRAAMSSITRAGDFEHTGDTAGGWSLCFDECPSLSRHWVVTGDVDDAMAQLRHMLEAEGFSLGEWDIAGDGGATVKGHRGRLWAVAGVSAP